MSIKKEDLPEVSKLVNKDQITEDTRLYFEIGHKLDMEAALDTLLIDASRESLGCLFCKY
jgi:hypothetical protein